MEVRIKHNKENIRVEKTECTEEEILNHATKIISGFYSDHINQIEINNQIIKFRVKIERI